MNVQKNQVSIYEKLPTENDINSNKVVSGYQIVYLSFCVFSKSV